MEISPSNIKENRQNFPFHNEDPSNNDNLEIFEKIDHNSSDTSPIKHKKPGLGLKSLDDEELVSNNKVSKFGSIHVRNLSQHPSVIQNISIDKANYLSMREFLGSLKMENLDLDKLERKLGRHVYFFNMRKGSSEWEIRRTTLELEELRRKLIKNIKRNNPTHTVPEFQYKQNDLPDIIQEGMLKFLHQVINDSIYSYDDDVCDFLEISGVPIEKGTKKYKECFVRKRSGGRYKESKFSIVCGLVVRTWNRRWLVIRQDGVLYSLSPHYEKSSVREMLLFDSSFKLDYGSSSTGTRRGIIITTPSRKLHIRSYGYFQFFDLLHALTDAYTNCPYNQINRFMSFAPLRPKNTYCKWYVDGENYYADVYNCLHLAKEEVFITDWWLSPELYLKRPVGPELNQDSRLDRVLKSTADRGVKIFVLLYKEVTFALTLNSLYTKRKLESLSPNIKVLRHPPSVVFLWSHHEKLVIIDQEIAFMGGLDLCYGRWDDSRHHLDDHTGQDQNGETWPGIDFYNVRIKDFVDVTKFDQVLIKKHVQPRMPWHDVALRLIGDSVKDLSRHFIQYWNFAKVSIAQQKNKKDDVLEMAIQTQNNSELMNIVLDQDEKNVGLMVPPKINRRSAKEKSIFDRMKTSLITAFKKHKDLKIEANDNGPPAMNSSRLMKGKDQKRELFNFNQIQTQLTQKYIPPGNPSFNFESRKSLMFGKSSPTRKGQVPEDLVEGKLKVDVYFGLMKKNTFFPEEHPYKSEMQQRVLSEIEEHKEVTHNEKEIDLEKPEHNNKDWRFAQKIPIYHNDQAIQKIGEESLMLEISDIDIEERKNDNNFVHTDIYKTKSNLEGDPRMKSVSVSQNVKRRVKNLKSQTSYPIDPLKLEKSESEPYIVINNHSPLKSPHHMRRGKSQYQKAEHNLDLEELKRDNDSFQKMIQNFAQPGHQENPLTSYLIPREMTKSLKDNDKENNIFNWNEGILDNQIVIPKPLVQTKKKPGDKRISLFKMFPQTNSQEASKGDPGDEDEFSPHRGKASNKLDDKFFEQNMLKPKLKEGHLTSNTSKRTCSCQVVRSSCSWSLGLGSYQNESSIHLAYVELIENSRNYIYIENQFFISKTAGQPVDNLISNSILLRIKKAISLDENFKVYVVMPLLPGFEGDIEKPSSSVLRIQLHWEYLTISRGGHSLLEQLAKVTKDPGDYIKFFGLRTHEKINDVPQTEMIYVHSKLMIVDDKFVILGSANINDRSMKGTRDSEIGIVVEDTNLIESIMDGKSVEVSEFAFSLRNHLFMEHFGLGKAEIRDPCNNQLWETINEHAKRNTEIYREVFACYPDDEIKQLSDLEEFSKKKNPKRYDDLYRDIIGHAVEFPLDFLKEQNLKFSVFTKEYLVPDINFT